jgi:hypothetical protein
MKVKSLSKFAMKYKELKEKGLLKPPRDAKRPLTFQITEKHYKRAKQCDENSCVVGQALGEALPDNYVVSVGPSITKVLNLDSGNVTRYGTPPRLREGLKHFDKTKKWDLPIGTYSLMVPNGRTALTINKTPEQIAKDRKRWELFDQRLKEGKTNGKGRSVHDGELLHARDITIVHSPRRRK